LDWSIDICLFEQYRLKQMKLMWQHQGCWSTTWALAHHPIVFSISMGEGYKLSGVGA
jgi:hypothetical protein